jgi:hypothetical protein
VAESATEGATVIWRIEFGGNPQDVTITTDGIASCHGFSAMSLELVEDPRWRLGMAVLIDHSSLDMSALTGSDVEEIAAIFVELDDRLGPSIWAVVAPDAYSEGLTHVGVRQLEPSRMLARTFPSRDRAAAWLSEQRADRVA